MKLLMKPVASLLSLSLIMTTPGLGCYEAAASGFKAVRVAPLSSAVGFNLGALGRLPVSLQGAGLTMPGVLMTPTLTSALSLPGGLPQVNVMALPALAGAAVPVAAVGRSLEKAGAVPTAVVPGTSWPQRLSSLGEEVKGIVSSRDVGDQAAGLGRIFEAGRRLPAASVDGASMHASRRAASGLPTLKAAPGSEGKISPELDKILRPGNTYDVNVSLADHPPVTEEDQLVYYLSVLEGVAYQHDRLNGKIAVQGITSRDIRVIAGFPAVSRIAGISQAPAKAARAAAVDERAERYRAVHASLEYLSGHGGSPISWLLPRMGWFLLPAVGYFALTWGAPALAASALLALAATSARSYALYKVADRIGDLYESWGEGLQARLRLEPSLNESEKARLAQDMYDLLSFPRRIRVFGRYYPIGTDENWHRWASKFRTYLASFLDDRSRRELVRLSFERSQYALGRVGKRDTTDANAYFSALMPLRLHPLLNERQKIDAIESMLEFHEKTLGQQGFIYPTDGQGFDEVDQMLRDGRIPSESIRSFYPRFYALLDRPLFLESRPLLLKVLNRMREDFKEKL